MASAVLVVVLSIVFQGGAPPLYWQGQEISDAQAVLARAEALTRSVARAYEGTVAPAGKCWFVLRNASTRDVEDRVYCGPAYLPWSSSGDPWLAYRLSATSAGSKERLWVPAKPLPSSTVALPAGEVLRRPGGGAPPSGAGGLRLPVVPRQRPGWGGLLEAPPAGLSPAPVGDVMVDWGATYRLVAYGFAQWLPVGLDRAALRSSSWPPHFERAAAQLLLPPRGERFVVAELAVSPGEDAGAVPARANGKGGPDRDEPLLQVKAGLSSLTLPFASGADVTVAGVVPAGSRPYLEVEDKGLTQTVSLANGKLGPAPAVLSRLGTDERLSVSGSLGGARVRLWDASLVWFAGSDGGTVPPSFGEAYLQVLATVSPAGAPLSASNFKLLLPGGQVAGAVALPDSQRQALVAGFLVPASFSYGTVVVSASGRSLRAPVHFE